MLNETFSCFFLISQSTADQRYAILDKYETIVLENAERNLEEISIISSILSPYDIIVLDGYNFDAQYQINLRKLLFKLVLIEDVVEEKCYADIKINHGTIRKLPSQINESIYLQGIKYLMVAPLFLGKARASRSISELNTVFICMGGADPYNLTNKVLQACCQVERIERIIVVIGAAASANIQLRNTEKEGQRVEIYSDIDQSTMAELVSSSQLAVVTSSTIALELSCMKIGILTGYMVDNQVEIYNTLISTGCALGVGNWIDCSITEIAKYLETFSVEYINEQLINQHLTIDGNSGKRILSNFEKLSN